jgi:DNA-binding response OmpR family regulator
MQGNVLVVEDDESIRGLLIEYLKERSHLQVDGARDGADALHQISLKRYPVIVLDLIMPHMTGIDFLTSLEALLSDPSVKMLEEAPAVLVITSAPPEEVSSEVLQRRFPSLVRGVMRKPLDIADLGGRVEGLLESTAARS